jgi:hypothetical protein
MKMMSWADSGDSPDCLSCKDSHRATFYVPKLGMARINPELERKNLGFRQHAKKEGGLAPCEDLLFPKFYLAEDPMPWLQETVAGWMKDHPD